MLVMKNKNYCLSIIVNVGILLFSFSLVCQMAIKSYSDEVIVESCEGEMSFLKTEDVKGVLYLCDEYEVKAAAADSAGTVFTLNSGISVSIKGFETDSEGRIWYQVDFFFDDVPYSGYIEKAYIACVDERVLAFWNQTSIDELSDSFYEELVGDSDAEIEAFPYSYRAALYSLKKNHPNWTFVKFNTNLVWNTVIENEIGDKSWIHSSTPDSWKGRKCATSWYWANEAILKYFMDPRNFLTESYIFQFEQLTYNSSYHTVEAAQKILDGTFMEGEIPGENMTYAEAFFEIGEELKVSPFHLASRVYQEQGKGTSPLISGTYPGYEGLYNYFNIGASGNTNERVYVSGLTRARREGWDTRYKSLKGGADILSSGYIRKGQDTLYLEKFDVDPTYNGLYYHQYMQNIQAPTTEAIKNRKAYADTDSLNNPFIFKIPVYKDMPDKPCRRPDLPEEDEYIWPFTDINQDSPDWKYLNIKYLYDNKIMNGITSTTFCPDMKLTRAMFVTVLYRAAGSPSVDYVTDFTDIRVNEYYSDAVAWAYKNGIVKGMGKNLFGPDSNITREQIAVMLRGYASALGYDTSASGDLKSFEDNSLVSSWAVDGVRYSTGEGIINGLLIRDKLYLNPQGEASRAECAAMIARFLQKH